ncbi:hypothetical protein WUBG_05700 [Wuchereria bancrofti]|uniref:Uncharacterized protein n=1 Tax=Wuchereria bancrofti TaxID=6293 RepID=J9F7P4_WUCBA|nr:hypothetical protein WUBG_05700 [Wuchereria bancrofti]
MEEEWEYEMGHQLTVLSAYSSFSPSPLDRQVERKALGIYPKLPFPEKTFRNVLARFSTAGEKERKWEERRRKDYSSLQALCTSIVGRRTRECYCRTATAVPVRKHNKASCPSLQSAVVFPQEASRRKVAREGWRQAVVCS